MQHHVGSNLQRGATNVWRQVNTNPISRWRTPNADDGQLAKPAVTSFGHITHEPFDRAFIQPFLENVIWQRNWILTRLPGDLFTGPLLCHLPLQLLLLRLAVRPEYALPRTGPRHSFRADQPDDVS